MSPYEFVKSSYRRGSGECVEVAVNVPGIVAVRDSKKPDGPILRLTPTVWGVFNGAVGTTLTKVV
jgi:hypothetical protein